MMVRLSNSSFLYINLALGFFVAVANGAALAMVLSGNAARLSGQKFEILMWVAGGAALAVSGAYALVRQQQSVAVLKLQCFLIAVLVLGLVAWATSLLLGSAKAETGTVWTVGYLSIVALYCAVLASHVLTSTQLSILRHLIVWVLLPVSIAVDVATYLKLAS